MENEIKNHVPNWQKSIDLDAALQFVGTGWSSLIREVFDVINSIESGPIIVLQVKEKWGGLRIYVDSTKCNQSDRDRLHAVLVDTENRSFKTCEQCGAPGNQRGNNWIYTSCEEHVVEGR